MNIPLGRATRTLALAATFAFGAAASSLAETTPTSAEDWSRLISPTELNTLMQNDADVQVIDIRREKYVDNGIIPGAVWVPFAEWRGPEDRSGRTPSEEELEALVGGNGLRLDQPIVIHNHNGKTIQTGRAAIVYWLLKSAGAEEIAILNGGFKAWNAADLPQASEPHVGEPYAADLAYQMDWWANAMHILAVTTRQADGAILDARLDSQIRRAAETGRPLMSMPMAQYIPASFFSRHLTAEQMTQEAQDAFRAELEGRGITLDDEFLISVCQTGELSALSWFYASEIVGIKNVKYYPDALKGWESDGGRMYGLRASL